MESLGGRYLTACDIGTYSEDMDVVARECRYVTGRTVLNGGGGDSSILTAIGVFHGMRAAAEHTWGSDSLENRLVGVEGVGKVGHRLVGHLIDAGARVVICDVSPAAIERTQAAHPGVQAVGGQAELLACPLEIYAPCAMGGALTDDSVAALSARIVCGGANNQLAHAGLEKVLADRGILYAPDYLVNAGGVIQVADERPASTSSGPAYGPGRSTRQPRGSSRWRTRRACRPPWPPTGWPSGGWPRLAGSGASGCLAEPGGQRPWAGRRGAGSEHEAAG